MNIHDLLLLGLRLTGVGQLFIAGITFWLRRIIGWTEDVGKLRPLNRCIVFTYGYYIQSFGFIFGLICLLQAPLLLGKTPLAGDLLLIMAAYWLGRLVLGFVYYYTREITAQRTLYRVGEYFFEALFIAQITALLGAFAYTVGWLKA